MFQPKENDGSFVGFEPIPEGKQTLMVKKAEALPQVNPHILKLEFTDAAGRTLTQKYDQDKKDGKGRYAQRYFMNIMLDALGYMGRAFTPAELEGNFVEVEIKHNQVQKKDRDTDELMFLPSGEPDMMTFANIGKVVGPGKPFATAAPQGFEESSSSDLDALLGEDDED